MKVSEIRQSKTIHFYAVPALLFLGIIATYILGYSFYKMPDDSNQNNLITPTVANSQAAPEVKKTVSAEKAKAIAQAQKPGTPVTRIEEIQTPTGQTTYKIHFNDGTQVEVAADNGAVDTPTEDTAESSPPQTEPEPAIEEPETTPQIEAPSADETGTQEEPQASQSYTPADEPV